MPDGIWGLYLGQLSPRPSLQQSVPCPEEGRNCKQERRAVWRERSTPPPQPLLPQAHREACGTHQPGATQALFARRPGAKCPTGSPRKPRRRPHFPDASPPQTAFCPKPSLDPHPIQNAGSWSQGMGLSPTLASSSGHLSWEISAALGRWRQMPPLGQTF